MKRQKQAFSLIELSLAVIIIAVLITIGMSASRVTKHYEVKRMLALTEEYANAFKAFYKIYNDEPGDMLGFGFFGDSNCTNAAISSTVKGCNGNNNGVVSTSGANVNDFESILAFYHLFKAKLIVFDNSNDLNINNASGGGGLSGCSTESIPHIGLNMPAFNIRNAGLVLNNITSNRVRLEVAGGFACSMGEMFKPFTPVEAAAIDRKYDNGLANSGDIAVRGGDCFTTTAYNVVQGDENLCILQYFFELDAAISNKF